MSVLGYSPHRDVSGGTRKTGQQRRWVTLGRFLFREIRSGTLLLTSTLQRSSHLHSFESDGILPMLLSPLLLLVPRKDVIRNGVPCIVNTYEKKQECGPTKEEHTCAFFGASHPC
jgi:hypothetical protein